MIDSHQPHENIMSTSQSTYQKLHFAAPFLLFLLISTGESATTIPADCEVMLSENEADVGCPSPQDEVGALTELWDARGVQGGKRAAVKADFGMQWPVGSDDLVTVPYDATELTTTGAQQALELAVNDLQTLTCINLVPRTTETDYIYFDTSNDMCSSSYGWRGGRQRIYLGERCWYRNVILHEVMHALGFFHEQQRSDRDEYITINVENIYPGYISQFDAINAAYEDSCVLTYDYKSVMQYNRKAGAIDNTVGNTMSWIGNTTIAGGLQTGIELSVLDIDRINCYYGCKTTAHIKALEGANDMSLDRIPMPYASRLSQFTTNTHTAMDAWFVLAGVDSADTTSLESAIAALQAEPISRNGKKYVWSAPYGNTSYSEKCDAACERHGLSCNFTGFTSLSSWERRALMAFNGTGCTKWANAYVKSHNMYAASGGHKQARRYGEWCQYWAVDGDSDASSACIDYCGSEEKTQCFCQCNP